MKLKASVLILGAFLNFGEAAQNILHAAPKRKVSIEVKVPGTLPSLISAADKYRITQLTLSGTLNGTDLRFLREMAGSDVDQNETPGRLTSIDLSGATFATGGLPYIHKVWARTPTNRYTLPKFLFRHTKVENLVLPMRTDTIGSGACEYANLKSISIPEGTYIGHYAFNGNHQLTEVTLPSYVPAIETMAFADCPQLTALRINGIGDFTVQTLQGATSLREVTICNASYVSGNSFVGLPALEHITFDGFIGHVDGYICKDLPALRAVDFYATVMNMGGSEAFSNCPQLSRVTFHAPVGSTYYGQSTNSPLFTHMESKAPILNAGHPECFNSGITTVKEGSAEERTACAALLPAWQTQLDRKGVTAKDWTLSEVIAAAFYRTAIYKAKEGDADAAIAYLQALLDAGRLERTGIENEPAFASIKTDARYADLQNRTPKDEDKLLSKLDILKSSPAYAEKGSFTYALPTDSGLQRVRAYFNVDSIAGDGDEISRIKRLMYYVHDLIPHDGSNPLNGCQRNAVELTQTARAKGVGLNCRMLATVLNELYLAAGFKARFLTCQSKAYDTDSDCHVINVVWSQSLNKWVWMDPSFAAYVTDENGLLLHPGEVRTRLIDGRPLVLNEDANWNHKNRQTKEGYLENYMAKNLYLLGTNLYNGYNTESGGGDGRGSMTLVPQGFNYNWGKTTSDADYFWQAPE